MGKKFNREDCALCPACGENIEGKKNISFIDYSCEDEIDIHLTCPACQHSWHDIYSFSERCSDALWDDDDDESED